MFAQSQRFETGFCKTCNKQMLLIRRGLGYEWRCKECGTECNTLHKEETDLAVKEGCTLKTCFIFTIILLVLSYIIPSENPMSLEAYLVSLVFCPFGFWIFARILSAMQK